MKFKLVRVISPLGGGRYGTLTFPPISLGILARHIRDCGFELEQDDLHRRWYSTASEEEAARLRRVAADEQRMWRYLEGGEDEDWKWFGDKVADLSDFEQPGAFLLSMISSDLGCCVATLAFARYLKERYAKPIILGGEYFVHAPIYDEIERVLPLGVLDYYVLGYGEKPLERLLGILTGTVSADALAGVQGLCWLDHGIVRRNSTTPTHIIVPPDFDGLPIELYRWSAECAPPDPGLPAPKDELTLPFHLSTGCPYNCSFCECSGMPKVTLLSPQQAVEELRRIIDQTGCRTFFFLDNTLNLSSRYVNELCDRIIKARLDIQWMDCASGRGMDRPTLEKMREAGVIRIVWGLESGSNRILEYVDKPVRIEQASKVLTMAHEVGLWNGVEIIVGLPTETEEEFEQTMSFLTSHAEVLDEVWAYQFYLNGNSAMLTDHERYGIENLRRVNVGLTKDAVYGAVAASHVFDERDGLRWEQKEEQQKRRLGLMLEHVAALGLYPMTWEHEQQPNLLSWCYRQRHDKAEIRSLYHRYWEKLYLRRTWSFWGRQGDSAAAVAREIFFEQAGRAAPTDLDQIWRSCYPDKWSPFYAGSQLNENFNYERSLLLDGRYHDRLVYLQLREELQASRDTTTQGLVVPA